MTPLTLSALLLLANVSATSLANDSLTGTATWYDAPSRTDAAAGPALRDLWETALIERLRIVGNDGKVAVHVCDLFGPDDPLTTDITASLEEER